MEQRVNPLQTNQNKQSGNSTQHAAQRRIANQHNASSQPGRTVGMSSNYGVARGASSLHVGDILRGEITDLRNNEISITLENNTIVRGCIPDSATYAIGQTRAFRLIDIAGGTLYLENVTKGYTDTERTLINKALSEANLPATEHNQTTVKALMDNLLPINRDSIQNLMQQAYDCHTTDMNTLAVMNRLMMEINEDSVRQFSNYRNDNYQLLEQLQNFSKDIPSLLSALAANSQADAVANFGKSMLSIGLSSSGSEPATIALLPSDVQTEIADMLSDTPLTEDITAQLNQKTLSLQDAVTLLRDAVSGGTIKLPQDTSPSVLASQFSQLSEILEPTVADTPVVSENYVKNILQLSTTDTSDVGAEENISNQTANAEQDAENIEGKSENRFSFAGKLLQTLSENAKNTFSDTLNSLKSNTATDYSGTTTGNHALDTLIRTYENYARSNDLLNSYLSDKERTQLADSLQNMPISRFLLSKIVSGEATTKEVLTVIYNTISLTDSESVRALFQTNVFEKLFARELQSSWTVTPEQLQKENLSDFYTKMHSQVKEYRHLIQSTLSGSDSSQLSGFAKNIEQNISFMKTLNETFSYFQVPLKLPSQDAHGDLYVYTKKEKLQQNPDKASILLHLDMEHLGKIDIKIDKNRQDINADFLLNDSDSVHLLEVNADMLKDALSRHGYQCRMHVQEKEQPSPTVDDFINTKVNTHATADMKRFSFDIRA
ncbi:MAG: flagellar hook-length control protein FliK [Butyribacter sp.]|nr:flagellar hook-length control protein FliK [bacterium]MDY3855291.1 flagellar hook-length control protein FliK [Butyribacter sp.]